MAAAEPTLDCEQELMARFGGPIICLDEVGRGSIAGPVMVGACLVSPSTATIPGVRDSKLLTAARREALAPVLLGHLPAAVGAASAEEIDAVGIIAALRLAGQRAVDQLEELATQEAAPAAILLDGSHDWYTEPEQDLLTMAWADDDWQQEPAENGSRASAVRDLPVVTRVKADMSCWGVAAASVVAKTERDAYMAEAERRYPGYGFGQHKGYGTAAHRAGIAEHGPSPEHRLTWLKG